MFLTAAEAAEILGMRPGSVDRLVHQGKLSKTVKHAKRGLSIDEVERASLRRMRPSQRHPYWVGMAEAAQTLGVTAKWVRELIARGDLPGAQAPSGRWYMRRHQLEVIANAREAHASADVAG